MSGSLGSSKLAALRIEASSNIAQVAATAVANLRNLGAAAKAAGAEVNGAGETAKKTSDSFSRYQTSIDGVAAAQRRLDGIAATYAARVDDINRRVAAGKMTFEDGARAIQRLGVVYQEYVAKAIAAGERIEAKFQQQTATTTQLAASTGAAGNVMRQFGVQSIDVFQQLASGAPVMTTFIQQGAQVGQVAANAGVGMGTLARAVGAFVAANAGILAGIGAVAALATGVALVASKSAELEAQQRTLSVAIQGVGRSAELSTKQLQGYVAELRKQGTSEADATGVVATLARNPAVSQSMAGRIAALAPDAAAALGVGVTDAAQKMADAVKGSAEAIEKLDDAFNLLSPTQAAAVRQMIDAGDKAGALDVVFTTLEARVKGLREQGLSPMAQALENIGRAWDGWMERIAKSELVQKIVAALARDINSIANAITGPSTSQEIVDTNNRLLRLQADAAAAGQGNTPAERLVAQSRAAEIANLQKRVEDLIARAKAEIPTVAVTAQRDQFGPDAAGFYRSKEIDKLAQQSVSGMDATKIADITTRIKQFRGELDALGPKTSENAARFDLLTKAIKADEDAIAALKKKGEEHRDGLQKYNNTIDAQIKAQQALAAAYAEGPNAVAQVTAAQKAQEKAISEGLVPGTQRYIKVVEELTAKNLELVAVTGQGAIAKQIAETNQATEAQLKIAAAYDGTAGSIERAQNEQKAYTAALRANLIPGTEEFAAAVANLEAAYQRSSDAAKAFQQVQSSVAALADTIGNAFDRLGQALVDAFVSGQGSAVNFGNVMKGIMASLLSDFAKMAVINPVRNMLSGSSLPTLGAAVGAVSGGQTDGGSGLLGTASNIWSGAGALDTLGLTNIKGLFSGLTGDGGLFGGIGNLLGTGLNGLSAGSATNAALASLGMAGPATSSQLTAAMGGGTIGGALGGIGGGFALGSLAGSYTQSAMGKTGYGPQIGAGLGAGAGFLLGGPIGGLIGGALGGAGGGLIGPNLPNSYSSTAVTLQNGQLALGQSVSQIADTAQEVAAASAQLAQINQYLSQSGITISTLGQLAQVGQNTPGKAADPTKFSDIASGFSQLRFTSDDPIKAAALADKTFGSLQELATALDAVTASTAQTKAFLDQTVPALLKASDGTQAFAQQLAGVSQPYDDAIAQAQAMAAQAGQASDRIAQLGRAQSDLSDARTKALTKTIDDAMAALVPSGSGELATRIAEIGKTYGTAIDSVRVAAEKVGGAGAVTDRLAKAETDLVAARDKAIAAANDAADQAMRDAERALLVRGLTADANLSGNPYQVQSAKMMALGEQQRLESRAFDQQLVSTFGDAYRNTQDYAQRMTALERTQQAERLSAQEEFARRMVAIERGLTAQIYSLQGRQATAEAAVSGDPVRMKAAAYQNWDEQTRLELQAQEQSLVDTYGASVRSTEMFAAVMQQAYDTLTAEWHALEKQYADQAARVEREWVTQVNSLYVRQDTANAGVSGDPTRMQAAALAAFDEQARQTRLAYEQQMVQNNGEAVRTTQFFANVMKQVDATLYAERLALQKQYADQSAAQDRARVDQMNSLTVRQATAEASVSNDPARIQAAALGAFDEQARLERQAAERNMIDTYGEGVRQTQRYSDLMMQLDRTLYAERLALQKQYADQSVQAQQAAAQTASGIIVSMTEYVRTLQTGPNSPLTAQAKYDLAARQFDVTRQAALGGDLRAIQNLTSYADTLVTASRGMFGSGIGYAQDIDRVVKAITEIAIQPPEMLTSIVFTAEIRGQTQELVDELRTLRDELVAIRRGQAQSAGAPPANRAA